LVWQGIKDNKVEVVVAVVDTPSLRSGGGTGSTAGAEEIDVRSGAFSDDELLGEEGVARGSLAVLEEVDGLSLLVAPDFIRAPPPPPR
jgi:hypothetical protein